MNPQEPVLPDPTDPRDPGGTYTDPPQPSAPAEYEAKRRTDQDLDAYDQSEADSFPASDPPAASEPGAG